MFVCLSVPKDLANPCTDMVLLYSVASYRSWECLLLFIVISGEGTCQRKIKIDIELILTKIKKKTFIMSLEANIGVAASQDKLLKKQILEPMSL